MLGTGFDSQRNADDGQPARALFLDHQQRLALIGGGRCLSARAQIDDRHAAGHRLVECAGNKAVGVDGETEQQGEQRGDKT